MGGDETETVTMTTMNRNQNYTPHAAAFDPSPCVCFGSSPSTDCRFPPPHIHRLDTHCISDESIVGEKTIFQPQDSVPTSQVTKLAFQIPKSRCVFTGTTDHSSISLPKDYSKCKVAEIHSSRERAFEHSGGVVGAASLDWIHWPFA